MFFRAVYASLALLGVLGLPLVVQAQSFKDSTPFTVSVSPEHPQPHANAVLSFVPGTVDLGTATVSVTVAGDEVYTGNARAISIPTGAAGEPTVAVVRVTANGDTYRKTIDITPQDVSLVVEPLSSVPPLYPGKSRIPINGQSRIVAIANLRTPNGTALDPTKLSYVWTVNGQKLSGDSGVGKSALMVSSPLQYRNSSVSVVVQSQDGREVGSADTTLTAESPTVRIYQYDPLLGIRFGTAISGSYAIQGAELSLYAAPFSFPTTTGAPAIQWFLNGNQAQGGTVLTLRPTGTGQGNARVSLTASSGSFSKASASVFLTFGSSGSTNIFGL